MINTATAPQTVRRPATVCAPTPGLNQVASLGLEPRITESKSGVLPLHYEAIGGVSAVRRTERKLTPNLLATWKIAQCEVILIALTSIASAMSKSTAVRA